MNLKKMMYGIIAFRPREMGIQLSPPPPLRLNYPSYMTDSSYMSHDFSSSSSGSGSGSGFLGTVSSFLAHPAVGAGMGLLQMLGGGINSWLQARAERKKAEEDKRRWEEEIKQRRAEFEANYQLSKQNYNLSRKQYIQGILQYNQNRKDVAEQNNYDRMQTYSKDLMEMLNSDKSLKSDFVNNVLYKDNQRSNYYA